MSINHASLICGTHTAQHSDCHTEINKLLDIK